MYLVLGKNGYLGQKFLKSSSPSIKIQSIGRDQLNYYNKSSLRNYISANKVSFIINSAGYTGKPNVDACEVAKAECLLGNAVLPGIIREVCEDLKIPWGHVSSGCIFSGKTSDGKGWAEENEPNFSFGSVGVSQVCVLDCYRHLSSQCLPKETQLITMQSVA